MATADLLTSYEICDRKGYWARDWSRHRLTAVEFLQKAVRAGLTETECEDFGELAGETVMELAADPGMEMPSSRNLHDSVVHHAALADMLTSALRKPKAKPWLPVPTDTASGAPWASSAFLDPSGTKLRRVVMPSSWTDARHYGEIRSWHAMGEMAMYDLPMTMVVVILGQQRDGKRNGPWTRGFLHPQNHKLRFRKKSRVTSEVFSDKWEQVWREDRGEITNATWLQAMLDDDILRDVCFTVEIPKLEQPERQRILAMAARKVERLEKLKTVPEASMSVCDRPPCIFKGCCWSEKPYEPRQVDSFVRIKPA